MEENKKDNVIGVAEPVVDEVENIGVINPDILKKKAAAAEEANEEVVEEIKVEQQQQQQQQTQPPNQNINTNTNQNPNSSQSTNNMSNNTSDRTLSDYENKRILAGIMGVLFGAYGVHNFIYGYTTKGIIQILMSTILAIFTCGLSAIAAYIWGLVEGILILTDQIKPNK
ncbi:MAG: TM2 domain containing protein [Fusobacteria bacterium]|nr:MAG: TM2 domain containing protein [Fusobacteriota bacterium]KAF0228740.1 MAG: TM2 domain containing [Fusobacteriota bacterium]